MTSEATGAAADVPPPEGPARRRTLLPRILIALGAVLAVLAIFALWANRQLLNTDNWTETSSNLLENDEIRSQLSVYLVDQLYANVDVQDELAGLLPPRARALAGPAAGGLKDLAVRGANTLLDRPRPQALWEQANRRAHARLLNVVDGGGPAVSTEGGDVTLDLKELLGQTADRVGVGGQVEQRIPEDAAQLTVMHSDSLQLAQDVVRLLRAAAIVLLVLAFGLFALAVYLAAGWRREALRATGFALAFAGAAALVARSLAGDAVVGALAQTAAVRPAAEAAWSISTSLMVEAATASIFYGVFIVVAAWLAGPTTLAIASRRTLAPFMREPRVAYGALAVFVLLLVAWGPTPAIRQPVTALLLIALLAVGVEVLRRQSEREFPDASREESMGRMRERLAGVGRWARREPGPASNGHANGAIEAERLEQLERLGRLRDSGVIDSPEFAREKAHILSGT